MGHMMWGAETAASDSHFIVALAVFRRVHANNRRAKLLIPQEIVVCAWLGVLGLLRLWRL